ncbi:MAG TPA: hypothetical protein PK967_04915 [Candidatus Hydrogenedentes bacterium]|nr:hypothetical protein [Candidatus Hydrogenedentota bacterium]
MRWLVKVVVANLEKSPLHLKSALEIGPFSQAMAGMDVIFFVHNFGV